jgi:hypothetical protein
LLNGAKKAGCRERLPIGQVAGIGLYNLAVDLDVRAGFVNQKDRAAAVLTPCGWFRIVLCFCHVRSPPHRKAIDASWPDPFFRAQFPALIPRPSSHL